MAFTDEQIQAYWDANPGSMEAYAASNPEAFAPSGSTGWAAPANTP
jgi:hypothetical protein